MRTCIDNRKRKVFNDIKHLSTKAVLLIIFLSLLPALQVMAMETPDETQQKSTIRVQGRVLDEFNQPLPGVSILAVKSTKGVITDIDGNYSIEVAPDEKLEFSYIGYQKNVVLVNGRKDIPIKMEPLTSELKEVTVVGYGTQRKASVIGAITGLPVGKINRSVNKLSNVLAGQMAGVVAVQRSGEPGEGSDFWIRGVSTFGANNRPLVLVDGIERDLNLVDPEDIETFSILKDATATAIYGVRGANGVVLITTRKGKEGSKPVISARAEFSILQPTKMPKMANAQEFMEMYNFAYADNKNGEEFYSPEAMAKYLNGSDPDLYPNINWMDEIYKNSTTSERVNINVTGGSEKVKYYVAGSYYKENGVFRPDKGLGYNPASSWSRFNFRSNLDINLFKNTVLNINLSNQYDVKKQPNNNASLWIYTFKTIPIAIPKKYSDGTVARPTIGDNPYNLLNLNGYNELFTNNAQSLIGLTQDFSPWIKGLKANIKFSWDAYNYAHLNRSKNPSTYYATGRNEDGNLMYTKNNDGNDYLVLYKDNKGNRTTYLEASLTYENLFANAHRVGGLFLFNMREKIDNFPDSYIMSLPYRNQGIAGRVTYSYKDRYFIEGNFGYNGSERFAKNERFGLFPSIGAGWMISEEKFWNQDLKNIINKLKLKGTYGLVGNDNIGAWNDRFFYMSEVNLNGSGANFSWGQDFERNVGTIDMIRYRNDKIKWEIAQKMNLGLEVGLFNIFDIQFDYFTEYRKNIFGERQTIPYEMGFSAPLYANKGEASSHGFEVQVDANHAFNKNFWLGVRGNFTYATGKYEHVEEPYRPYPWLSHIGKRINQTYGLIAERLFIDEEDIANSPVQTYGEYMPGDIKYKDVNNDGIINDEDIVPIGISSSPEIVYGFGVSMGYKNFDISCFFQGAARSSFFINSKATNPFMQMDFGGNNLNGMMQAYADDYWSESNRNIYATFPRLSTTDIANNNRNSTWWLRDGSYLRLKSVEIGYTLPKRLTSHLGMSNLRIYASGLNLFAWNRFKLWDVEQGNDGMQYPIQAVYNFGINLSF